MKLQRDHHEELRIIDEEKTKKVRKLLLGKVVGRDLMDPESGDVILKKKGKLTAEILKRCPMTRCATSSSAIPMSKKNWKMSSGGRKSRSKFFRRLRRKGRAPEAGR